MTPFTLAESSYRVGHRLALGIAGYQGGHMDILSRIAIVFSDTDEVDKLVAAKSAQEIYDLLNAVNEE